MFSDEFFDSLPEDVPFAVLAFCDEFVRQDRDILKSDKEGRTTQFRLYADAIAAFAAFCRAKGRDYALPDITAVLERKVFAAMAVNLFRTVRESVEPEIEHRETVAYITNTQQRFDGRFGVVFSYEFSEGELERIQSLINGLRDQISSAEQFEPKHKARIMGKLEALQGEMHRHMSSLDKLWGFVGDAGVVFGKLGTDAKPFVDRVKEIITITWEVQAKAEDLPTSTRLPFFQDEAEKLDSDGD